MLSQAPSDVQKRDTCDSHLQVIVMQTLLYVLICANNESVQHVAAGV